MDARRTADIGAPAVIGTDETGIAGDGGRVGIEIRTDEEGEDGLLLRGGVAEEEGNGAESEGGGRTVEGEEDDIVGGKALRRIAETGAGDGGSGLEGGGVETGGPDPGALGQGREGTAAPRSRRKERMTP